MFITHFHLIIIFGINYGQRILTNLNDSYRFFMLGGNGFRTTHDFDDFLPGYKVENKGEDWENWQKGPKLSIAEHKVEPWKFWLMSSHHFVFSKSHILGSDLRIYGSVNLKFIESENGYFLELFHGNKKWKWSFFGSNQMAFVFIESEFYFPTTFPPCLCRKAWSDFCWQ